MQHATIVRGYLLPGYSRQNNASTDTVRSHDVKGIRSLLVLDRDVDVYAYKLEVFRKLHKQHVACN